MNTYDLGGVLIGLDDRHEVLDLCANDLWPVAASEGSRELTFTLNSPLRFPPEMPPGAVADLVEELHGEQ